MSLYRDQGVVLRTIKLGEADRIVTIFTQGHGRVRAVAKGIRKTTSKFGARLEPASNVQLQCYRGRELDVVTQVETIDANRELREGYGLLVHAVPMLEAVDQVAQEREPNPALYRMLTGALRALAESRSPLVTPAFFWKLLSLEGFHPVLDDCAHCGDATTVSGHVVFDLHEGGVLCLRCAEAGGRGVSADALELMRRVLGGGLRGVLAEPVGGTTATEVERLAVAAIEHHIERRLRSAALL
jgi:DNA repair protein RecO (recombination protein O)